MVVQEGVHVLDEDLHWGFVYDVWVVAFVHHVLEQQHEEDEDLLETPGLGV